MKFPAFLARVMPTGPIKNLGSGTVLSPELIATCGHVVAPDLYFAQGGPAASRTDWASINGELKRYVGSEIADVYLCDGFARKAILEAVHDHLDLVLLRLSEPVPFLPTLDVLDAPRKHNHTAFGLFRADGGYGVLCEGVEPSTERSDSGQPYEISSCDGSIPEGTSGGPLITYHFEGAPKIAGLAVLGGAKSNSSRFINGNQIKKFFRDLNRDTDPRGKPHSSTDADGYISQFEATRSTDGSFNSIGFVKVPMGDSEPTRFMSVRPLVCAETDLFVAEDDDFTLAHLRQEEVVAQIASSQFGLPSLRLPRFEELQIMYASRRNATKEIAPNRPVTRFNLESVGDGSFQGMPINRPEWFLAHGDASPQMAGITHQKSRLQLVSRGHGALRNVACARVVLEVSGGMST